MSVCGSKDGPVVGRMRFTTRSSRNVVGRNCLGGDNRGKDVLRRCLLPRGGHQHTVLQVQRAGGGGVQVQAGDRHHHPNLHPYHSFHDHEQVQAGDAVEHSCLGMSGLSLNKIC